MKIGIIGKGFVGSAIFNNLNDKACVIVYDKYKNIGKFEHILNTDMVFLCLPTLFKKNNGYDKSSIYETCDKLKKYEYNKPVILKSTIEPETTNLLCNVYNLNFVHNPEFLSAKTACEDFKNQKHIVLGKGLTCCDKSLNFVINFYKQFFPQANISICTSTESESMKIFVNSFYATKIQFFNELYDVCQKNNSNYDNIKNLMLKNEWINKMHTTVPGPDGKLSYGGLCFPKDTKALLHYMKKKKSHHKVLKSVIEEQNEMR